MPHYVNHGSMRHCIECFGKIKFKQNGLPPRCLALIDVLISPSQAILYGSSLNKTILVLMNNRSDDFLSSISHKFGDNFKRKADQGYGSETINIYRV